MQPLPAAGTILQATAVRIEAYGAFVEFEGVAKQALVHISQLANRRVETVQEVVTTGDKVWVRILPEDKEKPGRVSASMKGVDQQTGADLGTGGEEEGRRRRRGADEEDVSGMTWGLQPLDRSGEVQEMEEPSAPKPPKAAPNYETTGKLAEASNMVNGVALKWSEASDAMKPTKRWRLYVFKGKESLEPYQIHRQSAYLLGRERRVADIPLDHPSCSSQHAVLQFRLTQKQEGDKTTKLVRPYIMDLGSTNGTYVNNERIEAQRYIELLERDLLRFGYSSREYVLLHEGSAG